MMYFGLFVQCPDSQGIEHNPGGRHAATAGFMISLAGSDTLHLVLTPAKQSAFAAAANGHTTDNFAGRSNNVYPDTTSPTALCQVMQKPARIANEKTQ